jgi:hypothetical protein
MPMRRPRKKRGLLHCPAIAHDKSQSRVAIGGNDEVTHRWAAGHTTRAVLDVSTGATNHLRLAYNNNNNKKLEERPYVPCWTVG